MKRKRKVLCINGNTVERFWDRMTRSSVTVVLDKDRNQVGDAEHSTHFHSPKAVLHAAHVWA